MMRDLPMIIDHFLHSYLEKRTSKRARAKVVSAKEEDAGSE